MTDIKGFATGRVGSLRVPDVPRGPDCRLGHTLMLADPEAAILERLRPPDARQPPVQDQQDHLLCSAGALWPRPCPGRPPGCWCPGLGSPFWAAGHRSRCPGSPRIGVFGPRVRSRALSSQAAALLLHRFTGDSSGDWPAELHVLLSRNPAISRADAPMNFLKSYKCIRLLL